MAEHSLPEMLVLHAAEMAEALDHEASKWPSGSNSQKLFQEGCNTLRAVLRANGYGPGAGDRWQPEPSQRWCVLPVTYVKELRHRADAVANEIAMLRRRTRAVERVKDAAMEQPNPIPALQDALLAMIASGEPAP